MKIEEDIWFAIETFVQARQDRKSRNWTLDYTPPMPGDLISESERVANWHLKAVHAALNQPLILGPGVPLGADFGISLLVLAHDQGQNPPEFGRARFLLPGNANPLQEQALRNVARWAFDQLVQRIGDNLRVTRHERGCPLTME